MTSRVTNLLLGIALVAFSVACIAAAIGDTILFAYATTAGYLLGAVGLAVNPILKGQHKYFDPVFPALWTTVLAVTDAIFVSLILFRISFDFRAPESVYWLGAAALAVSAPTRLLPAVRRWSR